MAVTIWRWGRGGPVGRHAHRHDTAWLSAPRLCLGRKLGMVVRLVIVPNSDILPCHTGPGLATGFAIYLYTYGSGDRIFGISFRRQTRNCTWISNQGWISCPLLLDEPLVVSLVCEALFS